MSRHIHRNPIHLKRPLVKRLDQYKWSSYPAYINQSKAESLLYRAKTYELLGKKRKFEAYKSFVVLGNDEETLSIYNKGNVTSVIGDKDVKKKLIKQKKKLKVNTEQAQLLSNRPMPDEIIEAVACVCKANRSDITNRKLGRQTANLPRKVAIYLCQQAGDMSLNSITQDLALHMLGVSHQPLRI